MTGFHDSWVLVTSASSGFGEEFARQYAEHGYSLVLTRLMNSAIAGMKSRASS